MQTTDNFSKRFLTVCAGISMILLSGAAFMYTAKPSHAKEQTTAHKVTLQDGSSENFIPLGIANGTAYWIVYNNAAGYKFRKSAVSNPKWEEK